MPKRKTETRPAIAVNPKIRSVEQRRRSGKDNRNFKNGNHPKTSSDPALPPIIDPEGTNSDEEILALLYEKMFHRLNNTSGLIKSVKGDRRSKVMDRLLNESPWAKEKLASLYMGGLGEILREDMAWKALVPDHNVNDAGLDVFIESGSTLLFVSYELYKALQEKEKKERLFGSGNGDNANLNATQQKLFKRLSVKTNNNLTAWLYLRIPDQGSKKPASNSKIVSGPDEEAITPFLISGYLEGKYHGVFPFQELKPSGQVDPKSMDRMNKEEQAGYSSCRIELSRCNLLLLATSRLSLLYGPTVGSRQNAIFKNATYNACVPNLDEKPAHVLHLFISARKLLAHHPFNEWLITREQKQLEGAILQENPGDLDKTESLKAEHNPQTSENRKNLIQAILEFARTQDKGKTPDKSLNAWIDVEQERFYTFDDEIENLISSRCFPAFDVSEYEGANGSVIQSPFSSSLCKKYNTQPLRDGTSAVSIGEGRFRVCSSWRELFSNARLSLDVFISYKSNYLDCPLSSDNGDNTWRKCSLDTWIDGAASFPCKNELNCSCQECWIRREVQFAQDDNSDVSYSFSVLKQKNSNAQYQLGRISIRPFSER